MPTPRACQIHSEMLEPRRLFAAWCYGPVVAPTDTPSATYAYAVDETGYHWSAEIGDVGQPKTYLHGKLFHAYYDEALPDHSDDPGPDRAAFYARLLDRLERDYASRNPQRPVELSVVEHDGGTFEVIAVNPDAEPARPMMLPPLAPFQATRLSMLSSWNDDSLQRDGEATSDMLTI